MKCCILLFLSWGSIALCRMQSKLPTCAANLRLLADNASSPFTLLLGLGPWADSRSQPHHWQEWWLARVSRSELLNGCMSVAIQPTRFLSVGSSGCVRCLLVSQGWHRSCAVRRATYSWLEQDLASGAAWAESEAQNETSPQWPSLKNESC